jgi:hypothetical protein
MSVRVFITGAAMVALVAAASAPAKPIPVKHPAPHVAKRVAKRHVVPRVLCICVPLPVGGIAPAQDEIEVEARSDVDQISHGIEPAYAYLQTTPEQQAEYDAVLVANGLSPYFNTAPTSQAPSA